MTLPVDVVIVKKNGTVPITAGARPMTVKPFQRSCGLVCQVCQSCTLFPVMLGTRANFGDRVRPPKATQLSGSQHATAPSAVAVVDGSCLT
jgi:hypothetical protein